MQFEKAMANKLYRELVAEATQLLAERGCFSMEEVLENTEYTGFDDDMIRWDFVRRAIEEEHNTELICVAENYFIEHTVEDEKALPAKFLPIGYGKKTAGFAIVGQANGHLEVRRLEIQVAKLKGLVDVTAKHHARADQLGISNPNGSGAPRLFFDGGTK